MAYEKVAGPLGQRYSENMLAAMHEQLQSLTQVCAHLAASWNEGNAPKVQPEHIKRPHEVFTDSPDEDEIEQEQSSGLEALIAEAKATGRYRE